MMYLILVGGGQDTDVAVVPGPVLVLEHPHGTVLLLLHLLSPGTAGGQDGQGDGGVGEGRVLYNRRMKRVQEKQEKMKLNMQDYQGK